MIDRINAQETDFNTLLSDLKMQSSILAIALGGSRSKKHFRIDSDYDVFCLVDNQSFSTFRDKFATLLHSFSYIYVAAYAFYLENWGYLYKAMSKNNVFFDISILPSNRIDEMRIRSSNIILYDPYGLLAKEIKESSNKKTYSTKDIEINNKNNYSELFYFEWLRYEKAYSENNYWLALKAVERMKKYYMHMRRIKNNDFSSNSHCPENNYSFNDYLLDVYKIDGSYSTLRNTAERLKEMFVNQFKPFWE